MAGASKTKASESSSKKVSTALKKVVETKEEVKVEVVEKEEVKSEVVEVKAPMDEDKPIEKPVSNKKEKVIKDEVVKEDNVFPECEKCPFIFKSTSCRSCSVYKRFKK